MRKAKKYTVKGVVQGVGFRYFTYHVANAIGIYGYVRNLSNGNVEVYAIGTEDQLKILRQKLQAGPSYSHVEELLEEDSIMTANINSFSIK